MTTMLSEKNTMGLYAERIALLGTENAFKIGPHIQAVEQQGSRVIKLNLGEPDFSIPDFIKTTVKRQIDQDNTHYCDPKGLLSLRRAVAKQIEHTRQLQVDPEQVVVFPGGKPSIGFTQEVYCNPGDEVIYPSPGFPIYESFTRYLNLKPVPYLLQEEEGFSMQGEKLRDLITPRTKLIILNFPSNPTGEVASREQLEGIARVIQEECSPTVRVYSDEIYEYILFDGRKHISIASLPGMASRTIISSGMSKTFAWTGGRIGYAVFPTVEEAEVFKNLNINYFSCIPPYNQEGAREALENPASEKRIHEMVSTFEQRRDFLVDALNAIPGLSCRKPGGAFYVFPNIAQACESLGILEAYEKIQEDARHKTSPAGIFQMFALYKHGVAVMDRASFGQIGSEGQHYIRLSSASELTALEEGVRRLAAACGDVQGCHSFIANHAHLYLS